MIYSGSEFFYFWMVDPDPNRVFIFLTTTRRDDKIVPEKIQNLIIIFSNKRC